MTDIEYKARQSVKKTTETEVKALQSIKKKNTIVLEQDQAKITVMGDLDLRYMEIHVIDYVKGEEEEHVFSININ